MFLRQFPYYIAEIAPAHAGSLGILHSYIDAVAKTGAHAVKFHHVPPRGKRGMASRAAGCSPLHPGGGRAGGRYHNAGNTRKIEQT